MTSDKPDLLLDTLRFETIRPDGLDGYYAHKVTHMPSGLFATGRGNTEREARDAALASLQAHVDKAWAMMVGFGPGGD